MPHPSLRQGTGSLKCKMVHLSCQGVIIGATERRKARQIIGKVHHYGQREFAAKLNLIGEKFNEPRAELRLSWAVTNTVPITIHK